MPSHPHSHTHMRSEITHYLRFAKSAASDCVQCARSSLWLCYQFHTTLRSDEVFPRRIGGLARARLDSNQSTRWIHHYWAWTTFNSGFWSNAFLMTISKKSVYKFLSWASSMMRCVMVLSTPATPCDPENICNRKPLKWIANVNTKLFQSLFLCPTLWYRPNWFVAELYCLGRFGNRPLFQFLHPILQQL